jgi:flagellar biosynthesis regulator FlaF
LLVDDIIKSLEKENKLNHELRSNLTAMKTKDVKAEKIIEAIRTDLTWNTFIGTVKKLQNPLPNGFPLPTWT